MRKALHEWRDEVERVGARGLVAAVFRERLSGPCGSSGGSDQTADRARAIAARVELKTSDFDAEADHQRGPGVGVRRWESAAVAGDASSRPWLRAARERASVIEAIALVQRCVGRLVATGRHAHLAGIKVTIPQSVKLRHCVNA